MKLVATVTAMPSPCLRSVEHEPPIELIGGMVQCTMHDKPDPIHAQRSRVSRGHRVDQDGRAGGRHRRCRARDLPVHSREAAVAETVDDVVDVLTTQLARAVVEKIAPEELPPFDPQASPHF